MLKIKLVDRITNAEISDEIKEKRTLRKNLKNRKAQMIDIPRIAKGYFRGRTGKEKREIRPRLEYFLQIMKDRVLGLIEK